MNHAKPSTAKEKLYQCPSCRFEAEIEEFVTVGLVKVGTESWSLCACPKCNHEIIPEPAKPKKPPSLKRSRLNPMSTDTRKRYEANRGWRARFVKEVNCCQNPDCTSFQWNRELYPLHVHEIPNSAGRQKATAHRDCCLVLCDYCNGNIFTDKALWPVARQCALKLLTDPLFFNLPLINELRGRAPGAITISDLAPYLELKR